MERIPFAIPDIGQEEIGEVIECLHSGWISTGPRVKKFETDFLEYLQENCEKSESIYASALNSATAGLHLSLEALGISEGDEVITTPYTFTATAEVIEYIGAKVVFADICPKTLNIDPQQIAKSITSRTKAVVIVHFAGLPCDIDEIVSVCKNTNQKIYIVEDAAHALPSYYKGQKIGLHKTDAIVYSFYATKTITTGEGGMVVSRHQELIEKINVMKLHGIDRSAYDRYNSTKPSWYYEIVYPGYKYNMTDLAASIGIHQLKKANLFQEKRQKIAEFYLSEFDGLPILLPPSGSENYKHSWHLFTIRLKNSSNLLERNTFIEKMNQLGVNCSVHFIPLHLHPFWRKKYSHQPNDFPNSLDTYCSTVSLPIYTKMSDSQIGKVAESVRAVL